MRLRPPPLGDRVRHVAQAQVVRQPRPGLEPALPGSAVGLTVGLPDELRPPGWPGRSRARRTRGRRRPPAPPSRRSSPRCTTRPAASGAASPPCSAARCSEPTTSEATSGRSHASSGHRAFGRRPSRQRGVLPLTRGTRCTDAVEPRVAAVGVAERHRVEQHVVQRGCGRHRSAGLPPVARRGPARGPSRAPARPAAGRRTSPGSPPRGSRGPRRRSTKDTPTCARTTARLRVPKPTQPPTASPATEPSRRGTAPQVPRAATGRSKRSSTWTR